MKKERSKIMMDREKYATKKQQRKKNGTKKLRQKDSGICQLIHDKKIDR